jgi:adenylate cyclase
MRYEIVGRVVSEWEGAILNFAGDGILSLVGAPVPCADHSERAIRIALEIWNRFGEMLKAWQRLGLQVGLGTGVASGFVTVGTILSSDHLEYTGGPDGKIGGALVELCRIGPGFGRPPDRRPHGGVRQNLQIREHWED